MQVPSATPEIQGSNTEPLPSAHTANLWAAIEQGIAENVCAILAKRGHAENPEQEAVDVLAARKIRALEIAARALERVERARVRARSPIQPNPPLNHSQIAFTAMDDRALPADREKKPQAPLPPAAAQTTNTEQNIGKVPNSGGASDANAASAVTIAPNSQSGLPLPTRIIAKSSILESKKANSSKSPP